MPEPKPPKLDKKPKARAPRAGFTFGQVLGEQLAANRAEEKRAAELADMGFKPIGGA